MDLQSALANVAGTSATSNFTSASTDARNVTVTPTLAHPTKTEPVFKDSKIAKAFSALPGEVQDQVSDVRDMYNNAIAYIKTLQSKNGTPPWTLGTKEPKKQIKMVKPDNWVAPDYKWHSRIFLPGDYHCREGLDVHIEYFKDGLKDADIVLVDMVYLTEAYKELINSGFKKASHQTIIAFGGESVQHHSIMWPYAQAKRKCPLVDLFSTPRPDADIQFNVLGPAYSVDLPNGILKLPQLPWADRVKKALIMYTNCYPLSGRGAIISDFLASAPDLSSNQGSCFGGSANGE